MAITAPYKSGTVDSVSGTTFTASASTFDSGDVGRLIILTDGAGKLQHRKIVSQSNATTVTVDHAWDATPWLDTVADVNPSNGDSFVVSYIQSDSSFTGESGVTVSGEQIAISALELTGDAYVHIINAQVDLSAAGIEIGRTAGMIFGWYEYIAGEDAQVRDSCHIIDATTGGDDNAWARGGSGGADFGMLDFYGCVIQIDHGGTQPFWRTYLDGDTASNQCRWINIQAFGGPGVGSRIDGDRSILISEQVGARTTLGVSNPRSAVSRVEISAVDCDQAAYVWLDVNSGGPSGRLVFIRLRDIRSRVIRCATVGHSGTNVMEVIAKKSEIDAAPAFIQAAGNPSGTHTFRYGNIIRPTLLDTDATLWTEDSKCVLKDTNDTIVTSQTVSDGQYPREFVRHTDIPTTNGDLNLSDGTQFAPYTLNIFSYGKSILSQTISVEDTFDSPLTLLDNLDLTEQDKSAIDAYNELENNPKLYDRAYSYLFDNYAGETEPLISRNGDLGAYDMDVDATASPAFQFDGNKFTIHADTFTGDLTTTGTITLLNGAAVNGTITDQSGTIAPPTGLTVNGALAGSQIVIYESGTTTILESTNSGTSLTYSSQTPVSAVDYTVYKDDQEFIRVAGVSLVSGSILSQTVSQSEDREYATPSGLSYGINWSVNTSTKRVSLTAASATRNLYSAMKDLWISRDNPNVANVQFPMAPDGNATFSFLRDWEMSGAGAIANLSRGGFRYVSTAGAQTAIYAAIQTPTQPSGTKIWYLQVDGGSWALLDTGTGYDGMLQVFGDATHGGFDRTDFLALKATNDGYTVDEWDVINDGGQSEIVDNFYFAPLSITLTGEATGDPGALSITINNIADTLWNGITAGQEVVVDDGLTGSQVIRYLTWQRHQGNFLAFGALVSPLGGGYQSVRGRVYDGAPLEIEGCRVVLSSDGTTPHPDFSLFEGEPGETYEPAPITTITVPNIIDNSKFVFFRNGTQEGGLQTVTGGSGISLSFTLGVDYSDGDTFEIWIVHTQGLVCKQDIKLTGSFSSTAASIPFNDTQTDCPTYTANAIDGSLVTGHAIDNANNELDIVVTGTFDARDSYAFLKHAQQDTLANILDLFEGFVAQDQANYYWTDERIVIRFNGAGGAADYRETSGVRWTVGNVDGAYPAVTDSRVIINHYGRVLVSTITVGGVNVITGDIADIPSEIGLATGNLDAQLSDIYADTQRVDALIEDSGGDRFTAKALEEAGGSGGDVNVTQVGGVAVTSPDDLKADVSGLSTFDHTTDQVVASNMRGTDGANTVAPDNASIAGIQAQTDRMQFDGSNNILSNANIVSVAGTNVTDIDDFKADVSGLATAASIAALNDFDPATDVVARVTLVDTTTANTDMRGTDNALLAADYTAPDNSGNVNVVSVAGTAVTDIDDFKADVSNLDVAVSTRLALTSYTAPDNAGIATASAEATLARKHVANRDRIDALANTLTRYDDDGVTPIRVYNLTDSVGLPSNTTVYEKTPQ